jgi:DHA1 family multidrug resistance protein-like MFS transporter
MTALKLKPFLRLQLITFLYDFGANFIHPVTPTLILENHLPDNAFGILFATMALGSFIFSTFWGRMSDKKRRSSVMLVSLVGYALAQLAFGLSRTMPQMLVARLVAGCFTSGTSVCLMALIVDQSDPRERAAHLSYYAAMVGVSAAAGYFAGGMIGLAGVLPVFYAQTALLFAAAALVYAMLRRMEGDKPSASSAKRLSMRQMIRMMTLPALLFLLGVTLSNFGNYGFDNALNYYMKRELGFSSSYNGIVKAASGLIGLAANVFINRWIMYRFDAHKSLPVILLMSAASLTLAALMPTRALFFAVCAVFFLVSALHIPIQQALTTEGRHGDIGLLSGLFYSARFLGMIFGPLISGFAYEYGAKIPFYTQAAAFVLAAVITYFGYQVTREHPAGQA